MTRKEEIRNASVAYNEKAGKLLVIGGDGVLSEEEHLELNKNPSFIAGAEWAIEQYEKNRLTACDNMTDEEFEREQKFVIEFLKDNHRTPTFSDCIEITRKEMLDKAWEWLSEHLGFFVTYFDEDFIEEIDRSDFIKNFRKAMEE